MGRWTATGAGATSSTSSLQNTSTFAAAATPEVIAAVDHLLTNATRIEPRITRDLVEIASTAGGRMEGLEYRFKARDGIIEKVGRKVLQSQGVLTPEVAVGKIHDVLRYTMTFPGEAHSVRLAKILDTMNQRGLAITAADIENNWQRGDAYNGINATFTDVETNMRVEIQFHTPESWHVKQNVNHDLYEKLRSCQDCDVNTRRTLHTQMVQASDSIPIPDGVANLGQLVYRPFDG